MAMIELTISELSLVAGGDAGFSIALDDAGPTTFSGTGFSQPTFLDNGYHRRHR